MGLRITLLQPGQQDRSGFRCGVESLDAYLRKQAGQHLREGIATTHVLIDEDAPARILGYVSLAAAQVALEGLQPTDQKHLPRYPVPAVRVARLAVAQTEHGKGHGRLLLGHAVNIGLSLRDQLGVWVLLVDAINTDAADFYRAFGFSPTAHDALTLYLPLGRRP